MNFDLVFLYRSRSGARPNPHVRHAVLIDRDAALQETYFPLRALELPDRGEFLITCIQEQVTLTR